MNPVQQGYGAVRDARATSPNVTYEYDDGTSAYRAASYGGRKTHRMANRAIIVFVGFIVLIIVGIGLLVLWPGSSDTDAGESDGDSSGISLNLDFLDDWKNGVVNAALDVVGVKDTIKESIEAQKSTIQSYTGMSDADFAAAMDDLAIDDWTVISLPSDAVESGSMSGTYQGIDATIVTYDDPSYVTVQAYGQDITLSMPESAQDLVSLLEYAS